jgi:hypothetical protein
MSTTFHTQRSRGFRGTGGYCRREQDEGQQQHEFTARYAGKCVDTGAPIKPGDTVQKAPGGYRLLRSTTGYVSNVIQIGGKEYYRNKAGLCEDAPCCGCCTI